MTIRRAGALTLLLVLSTLTITTASTARPSGDAMTLSPDDFQPLVLPPAGSPFPSFDLGAPADPRAIPDFAEVEREVAPRATPGQRIGAATLLKPTPTPKPTPRPAPKAAPKPKATPKPKTASSGSTTSSGSTKKVSGTASWYCLAGVSVCHYKYSGGMYAAAGPALRVGNWRGRTVRVCADGSCVKVKLVDWCQCYGTRVIDLYSDPFKRLAPLSKGTVRVIVSW